MNSFWETDLVIKQWTRWVKRTGKKAISIGQAKKGEKVLAVEKR